MLRFFSRLSLLSLLITIVHAQSLSDISGHRYEDSIRYLADQGIVQWYPDGNFGPDNNLTRAEMLKIILGAVHDTPVWSGYAECFSDVQDERHAPYICYAKDTGIIKWYADNSFKPDQAVTIAEGLKMTLLAFETGVREATWSDRYYPFIEYVHTHDIFSRYALSPHLPLQRWMMAFLVQQLMLDKSGVQTLPERRDTRSAWCFVDHASPTVLNSVEVYGETRPLIMAVGKNYTQQSPARLIIAFHGRTNSNDEVRKYYQLEKNWDNKDIIVYPSWLPVEWPSRSRRSPGDPNNDMRDFALFDTLVDKIGEQYCIDKEQIYVVWHSLGAWFTNTLACARWDVIRGIWSVWGGTTTNECSWPVAAMIMHNPEDRLSSFVDGLQARDQLLAQNGCSSQHSPTWPADANCVEYTDCVAGAPVVWCEHTESVTRQGVYYPHTRPSFAGKMIWDFIVEQQ